MNYRIRILQLLLLALGCIVLLLYTSYDEASPKHIQMLFKSSTKGVEKTSKIISSVSSSSSSSKSITSGANGGKNVSGKTPVNIAPVKHIPKKVKPPPEIVRYDVNASFSNSSAMIRDMYVPGHVIPNAGLCPKMGSVLKLLVLITSSPDHTEARLAIRQTWGYFSRRKDIGMAFIVGVSKTENTNKMIAAESNAYEDIIQCSFEDAYVNLTLKTICMLEWVENYCAKVSVVLKTDDDMFINIPRLLDFIEKRSPLKKTIVGRLAKGWKPVRNPTSKYRVSTSQFLPTVLPDFTTGPAYLFTTDIVHDMYASALNSSYLKLEDVFITGVIAGRLGIKRAHSDEFLNRKVPLNACNVRKSISIHMIKQYEQYVLWEKMHDTRIRCK